MAEVEPGEATNYNAQVATTKALNAVAREAYVRARLRHAAAKMRLWQVPSETGHIEGNPKT